MNKLRTKLIKTLLHMKDRCYKEKDKHYKDYGGRGIDICKEWLEDKEKFIEWSLNNGCRLDLTIDRIDNDKGYYPDNCRWVTISENNQNRRSSRFYTFNGKTQNLQQWCTEYNMSRSVVNKRLSIGWDFSKAITTPVKVRDTTSLIGKKYGRLTVIEFSNVDKYRKSKYKCLCECGKYTIINKDKLTSGHTKSCGCIKQEMYNNNKNLKLWLYKKLSNLIQSKVVYQK